MEEIFLSEATEVKEIEEDILTKEDILTEEEKSELNLILEDNEIFNEKVMERAIDFITLKWLRNILKGDYKDTVKLYNKKADNIKNKAQKKRLLIELEQKISSTKTFLIKKDEKLAKNPKFLAAAKNLQKDLETIKEKVSKIEVS